MPLYQNVSDVTQAITITRSSGFTHTYVTDSLRFLSLTDEEVTLVDPEVLQLPIWKLVVDPLAPPPPPPPPTIPTTTTDDIPEGVVNKYYHETTARDDLLTTLIEVDETETAGKEINTAATGTERRRHK